MLLESKCVAGDIDIETKEMGRWHIFNDGTRDAKLSCEIELIRDLFSSLNRIIAEILERFQPLHNLTNTFAYPPSAILLGPDDTKCNLDYVFSILTSRISNWNDFDCGFF